MELKSAPTLEILDFGIGRVTWPVSQSSLLNAMEFWRHFQMRINELD